ncbi:MAG: hypothetical protein VX726_07885 [Planctomycetota bacterium]|nr:hypothetical protein [Planctomycetota bacterium]
MPAFWREKLLNPHSPPFQFARLLWPQSPDPLMSPMPPNRKEKPSAFPEPFELLL